MHTLQVVDMPVVVQRQVRRSTIQKTVAVPQLQFLVGRRLLRRAAEAHPQGPVCTKDHRDSASLPASWPRCRWQFCGIMRVSCHEEQFLVSSPMPRSFSCSSWTRLCSCPVWAFMVQTVRNEACGGSTGAVLGRGAVHARCVVVQTVQLVSLLSVAVLRDFAWLVT